MIGTLAFLIYVLWKLGEPAERHIKKYGKFSVVGFYTQHKIFIGRELGMAILIAVAVQILVK